MRASLSVAVVLTVLAGLRAQGPAGPEELPLPRPGPVGPEELPLPRPVEPGVLPLPRPGPEPCFVLPGGRLRELLQEFRSERDALDSAYTSSVRDFEAGIGPESGESALLKLRIREALVRLAKARAPKRPAPPPPAHPKEGGRGHVEPQPATPAAHAPKEPEQYPLPAPPAEEVKAPRPGPGRTVDPLALGQALFRAGNYAGALKAFDDVDLKASVVEFRAPVQYLRASCLRHLGRADEAVALYREVANARGDEHLAACARWQLTTLRWQREAAARLQEVRQRRESLGASAP